VLATDGDFNVGVTSNQDLVRLIEEKRTRGITLTTLGFGQGNIREDMMEQLADKGNGNYFYIDSFQQARRVLEDQFTANMQVVAKDVKLQVEFNPAHVASYRLIGFDNRRLNAEDFTDDKKDAGEVGSGHTVTALYEITFADSPRASDPVNARRYCDTGCCDTGCCEL
jgi:Ca-activated chloride channel family protein